MPGFLVDENLSPLLASHLRHLGYKARAVRDLKFSGRSDEEIIKLAKKNGFVIVTGDIDFGEMFYRYFGSVSILLLRSRLQGTGGFKRIILNLHQAGILENIKAANDLVVASEKVYRIRKFLNSS